MGTMIKETSSSNSFLKIPTCQKLTQNYTTDWKMTERDLLIPT